MGHAITDLLLLALVTAYSFWVGRRLLIYSGCRFRTPHGTVAASIALGLGVSGYMVLGVGLLGQLNVGWVLVLGVVVALLVWAPGRRIETSSGASQAQLGAGRVTGAVPVSRHPGSARLRSFYAAWLRTPAGLFVTALAAVALVGTLTAALAPPTAGDALCYHLEIPKRFVQQGEIRYLPFTDNSLFPFLMEMLYTLGLLLSGPVLAQLMHWLMGVLLALAVVELAEPVVGRVGSHWAAALALLVPGVTNQMTAPLNDLAATVYSALMVTAWAAWCRTGRRRWAVLGSVFGGLALSVKLVAAGMVLMVALAIVVRCCRRVADRARWLDLVSFAGCVVLAGSVWYLRSWYHLGNPVYPYFNGWFGLEPHTRSVLRICLDPVAVPWQATMHPELFGGRGTQLGVVFLALVPGVLVVRRAAWRLGGMLAVSCGFGVLWFAVRQDLRFLLPAVPVLAMAAVAVLVALRTAWRPAFLAGSLCLLGSLVLDAAIVLKRARPCVAVAWGGESRDAYLRRREPSYAVAEFVNRQLPAESRLISQDFRALYYRPEFVREDSYRRRIRYAERGDDLVRYLRAQGFTHVLLVDSHNPETAVYDSGFADRLGAAAARLPLVFASHFSGAGGDWDYRLLALPASDPAEAARSPRAAPAAN